MITIHASSLADLFDCPARWAAKNIEQRHLPSSPAAQLGTAVHAGTALFDDAALRGEPVSIDDTVGAVVDALHDESRDVDWGDETPEQLEPIATSLVRLYCEEIAPKMTYVAVEARCPDLPVEDLGITLTGSTDRIRKDENGCLGICDIKTGKTAVGADGTVKTQGHAAQMAVYELLAGQALDVPMTAPAIIIGLQAAKTAKGRRCGIGTITGAVDLLLGTEDQPGLLQMAGKMLKSGDFYGNSRSSLCSEKFCPIYQNCFWRS
jgi:RecB family exonuclease|uniref:PD-(D/E)XK nuclease superfamily protein n=1 Tax=Siphoviridae sp. ct8Hx23 TaxID=2825360 RepID=A0A8S5P6W9_9CAUD|nr:MAG TPA: PD-(D/E)XK nuclease superfamily protein [Siphoviridae sp. ct8Hx23]